MYVLSNSELPHMRRYGKHTALANKLKAWGLLQQEINDPPVDIAALHDVATGTQFACFTSTKVQILTQKTCSCRNRLRLGQYRVGGDTRVGQISRRYSVYLLY